jgi:acyl carrier protein
MTDVTTRLRKLVAEHLGLDEEKVVDSAALVDDLGADSLDAFEIKLYAEEEFRVDVTDDAVVNAITFGDLVKVIKKAVGTK